MSEIKLNLLDSHTTLIATTHGSVGDALVAALSADPETIAELEMALKRFQKCESIPASSLVRYDRCEIDEEPYDAGILVIDLASRIVAFESTYSYPGTEGVVEYHDGTQGTDFPIRYRLADDWLLLSSIEDYQVRVRQRIQERTAQVPLDARAVLYGEPLLDFIIQNAQLLHVQPPEVRSPDVLKVADGEHVCDVRYALASRNSPTPQDDFDPQDLLDGILHTAVWRCFRSFLTRVTSTLSATCEVQVNLSRSAPVFEYCFSLLPECNGVNKVQKYFAGVLSSESSTRQCGDCSDPFYKELRTTSDALRGEQCDASQICQVRWSSAQSVDNFRGALCRTDLKASPHCRVRIPSSDSLGSS